YCQVGTTHSIFFSPKKGGRQREGGGEEKNRQRGWKKNPRLWIWILRPFPTPQAALEKSPKPSTDTTAACSNGETKKHEAKCARWCSTRCRLPWKAAPGSRSNSTAIELRRRRLRRRSSTSRGSGRLATTDPA